MLWFDLRAELEIGECSGFELCAVDGGVTGTENRDIY